MQENLEESFNKWNSLKKKIESNSGAINLFPKEGEIWMTMLGKNIGYEQNGSGDNFSRPVLIVKKFNNRMFWCVPLSTKQKEFDFYYNFTDLEGQKVSAILAQLKLISVKRLKRKMYDIGEVGLKGVKSKIKSLI
jgi:mRNA interferase MazF